MKSNKLPVIGWVFYDFANSAFATTVLAVIFNRFYAEVVAGGPDGTTFHFPWGNYTIPGSAIWSFLVAISTGIVAISSPLLGAMADYSGRRKKLLIIYCYVGVLATITLSSIKEGDVLLGGFVFIIANLGFAGGNVFYNAFILDVSSRDSFGKVSGMAWGLGYLGGGLCLVLNLIMLQKPELIGFPEGYFTVGDCLIVAGVWWGIFALPTVLWLKEERSDKRVVRSISTLTLAGWRRLKVTLSQIRKYKQLVRFLLAYLLFNDGIDAVIIMATIFGAEVVGLLPGELVGVFIIIQAAALVGSFVFGWLADKIGNKSPLFISLMIWIGVVVWAYYIGWFIDPRTDFYIIGIISGVAMGGSQTCSRSMQAAFTPDERSAEFFGFWAVSGRFASVFGTATYGVAIIISGGVQSGILAIGAFFVLGAIVLLWVNEKDGVRAATMTDDN